MRRFLFAATFVLPLAACGNGDRDGTSISLNASTADGNLVAGIDKGGEVKINSPVFSGTLKLPKLKVNADNFDMNGVHLYPGSTISGMSIDARDGQEFEDDDGSVRVTFNSPAAPLMVRDWFREKLGAAGFTLKDDGAGLRGTTDEKKPFRLELGADGPGRSNGQIKIG